MKSIKQALDPLNILNPGKVIDIAKDAWLIVAFVLYM